MKRIFLELLALIAIGGLLWVAIAFFVNLPEHPVLLSMEKEKALGESYSKVILSMNGFKKIENPQLDEVFEETSQILFDNQSEAAYNYSIIVVDNEMVNAFALPGGYIILTKGLINYCETPEELIAVISHEIGHIEKRHVVSRLIKDIGLDILTSGDTFITGEIAKTILSQGYNRKQEQEADMFACELMLNSGLEPRSLASFFRRLKDEGLEGPLGQFEIVASHPNFNNRIKAVLSYEVPADFQPQKSWIDLDNLKELVSNEL